MTIRLLAIAALFLSAPAAAQDELGEVTPLFAADEVLEVTITGPIKRIAMRAEYSTDPYPAMIEVAGESHAIDLSARGKSRRRREYCRFPPLRVAFSEKPTETSLFHRQGKIKLVTHCSNRAGAEQTMLREYAVYRLYNLVTPESLKVRLVRVRYVDDGKEVTHKLGFFIEDADDAARRLGLKEVDTGDIPLSAVERVDAARYSLFQYMIGNTDWSLLFGPVPGDCCHNSRLLGASAETRTELTPVPYDFDNAGLVDARYAEPAAELRLRSVRTRLYRGFCRFNRHIPEQAANLRSLRSAFEAEIASLPFAEPRTVDSMKEYLAGFYADIADEATIQERLLEDCR